MNWKCWFAHKWGKWFEIEMVQSSFKSPKEITVLRQKRVCERCGRVHIDFVS